MLLLELFINYWRWHYTTAIRNIFIIWSDLIWFLWNYFSIRQLLRTFFVPWKRLQEKNPSILEFFEFFSSVVITFLMRIVGVIIRSIVIFIGTVALLITAIFGPIFLLIWLLAPILLLFIFSAGVDLGINKF